MTCLEELTHTLYYLMHIIVTIIVFTIKKKNRVHKWSLKRGEETESRKWTETSPREGHLHWNEDTEEWRKWRMGTVRRRLGGGQTAASTPGWSPGVEAERPPLAGTILVEVMIRDASQVIFLWTTLQGFPDESDSQESVCNVGGPGFKTWKILWGGHGNPLQYLYLENPMGRGAWWATVHGVAESQTQLSDQAQHTCSFIIWGSRNFLPPSSEVKAPLDFQCNWHVPMRKNFSKSLF